MLNGQDDQIPYPSYTKMLDYELEVACIIGKSGTNIREAETESHIAGYTIMNDWSARDIQQPEMKIGLGPATAKDFAISLGPWLVTSDELQDNKIGTGKFAPQQKTTIKEQHISAGTM